MGTRFGKGNDIKEHKEKKSSPRFSSFKRIGSLTSSKRTVKKEAKERTQSFSKECEKTDMKESRLSTKFSSFKRIGSFGR